MIVAQLSDIHADGSSAALERLDRVLGWLRPMRPDALIVSGDLAEAEHETSYDAVAERLDTLGCPLFVVPGNVDEHGAMRRAFGERYGWTADRPLHVVGRLEVLRLIGLDVTVRGAHHGDAAPALEWLEAELRSDGAPTLIFQHQHPFPCGIEGKDRNICLNGERLAALIERAGSQVLALTCGHVHRPLTARFAGRPATMAPSVAWPSRVRLDGREGAPIEIPGLLLHHFADGGLVSHVVMVS